MSSLFNSDYLLHLCKKHHLTPSKKYGQNYLIDESAIEKILEAGELSPEDVVVEVGPGFGVLTLALAKQVKKVLSFEIEKKLQPYWDKEMEKNKNIEIIWGNVIKQFPSYNLSRFASSKSRILDPVEPGSGQATSYKLVANLPYQITSPVIRTFLEADCPPQAMVLMVQKEVAERICAKPGDMSLLSVAVQYYASAEIITIVPRSAFWPSPAVDSAVIRLTTRPLPTLPLKGEENRFTPTFKEGSASGSPWRVVSLAKEGIEGRSRDFNKIFFSLVKAGFANRRKLLFKNLLGVIGKEHKASLQNIFSKLNFNPSIRAQELSVEQWASLAEEMGSYL